MRSSSANGLLSRKREREGERERERRHRFVRSEGASQPEPGNLRMHRQESEYSALQRRIDEDSLQRGNTAVLCMWWKRTFIRDRLWMVSLATY